MEIFAGFAEHTDVQVGRLVDGLEQRGLRDNTLIFYIWGDNGSSAEGQNGSISELLAQNNIPNTVGQQLDALNKIGGLEALGSPKTDNMYHAGWAWAGSTPFKATKLVASHFGGTRNPMVVSWPKKITPDKAIRNQFHHVIDIAPTIYEILDIDPPSEVNGQNQIPIDGTSLAYTFASAGTDTEKVTQFFDNNGSRGIYQDGWFASAFGPFIPWNTPASAPRIKNWDSATDDWELYNLENDFSQANDLAGSEPKRLASMKQAFSKLAEDNQDYPIGAGLWLRMHPEDRVSTPYRHWDFNAQTRRMPEFAAPGIGRESNTVVVNLDVLEKANGVVYALGGAGGGITLYLRDGQLNYLYNLFIIEQYTARAQQPLAAGKHEIKVVTKIQGPGQAGAVTLFVDGKQVAQTKLNRTVPAAFTASETFDVGVDLGSTVSLDYFGERPFALDGTIDRVVVDLD
ncbi:sulfatase domain-containing protein [Rhodopirellula baltica SH28]|uniref:Sulfatase domain-containing protein n=1 Tax=Rhodopirellula baltica SH28 TaxID=993517 RepID=K5D258_RHOBT|nr:sulfatase domain-containing protein [Rhodopirellula baltica SH28]